MTSKFLAFRRSNNSSTVLLSHTDTSKSDGTLESKTVRLRTRPRHSEMRSLVPKFKCLTCARAEGGKNNGRNSDEKRIIMQLAGRMEREGWRQDTAVNLVVILFVI